MAPSSLAQPDEQRLERERRRDLQLLRLPPGRTDELARVFGGVHSLERGVGPQLLQPVDVDGRRLRAGGDHDEISVPRLELLEQREELLALGAALGAPHALLRLPPRQLEGLDLHLGCRLRLGPPLADAGEKRLGAVGGLERRIG